MQARSDTKNFTPQMLLLSDFLNELSDKVLDHINGLDPRLGLWSSTNLASVSRNKSNKDDPCYDIQINSKAFETTLAAHFKVHLVSFEYKPFGMTAREADIQECTLDKKYYDELLKECLSYLNSPRPNNYVPSGNPTRGFGVFDARDTNKRGSESIIKEVIINWPQRQRNW